MRPVQRPGSQSATVVIISPDPAVREVVAGMLRFGGHSCCAPETPRESIVAASQPGVEGVVFDLDYGDFTPEHLAVAPSAADPSVPPWAEAPKPKRGAFDLVLTGTHAPSASRLARYAGVARTAAFTPKPLVLHEFRKALARFIARVEPTLIRPAGATGTMLAVPGPGELEPVEGHSGMRQGRYASGGGSAVGSEHRVDQRFEWGADAVLLGKVEERVRIVEISRAGLRLQKTGRELTRGSVVEVAFVERVETPRGPQTVGIRARGRVVWTAEGMAHVHAGLDLEAVEPLGEFIQLLASLHAIDRAEA